MIEKNIFQCYWNRNPSMEPSVNEMIYKYKSMNPGYTHNLYDDKDMDNFVNKYFSGDNLDSQGLENEIAQKLAQVYVTNEGVEQFLFLNKKTGRYVKYPTSELINTIGKDIVVTSMQDMTTRLSLKKPVN